MASKQLGKLRQWAGEVISSREKTQPSIEFVALEKDVEIRRGGVEKLQVAATDYLEYISSKVDSKALPGEDTMMHTEALGVVMIGYGEDLGDDGAFARSLSTFGRARCRIAAIQNIYAVTFADTFLAHLGRSMAEFEEHAGRRKKLESRRLAYDAALTKVEKTFKKEKDKKEAEDELERARERYEEMSEEVQASMDNIKENEFAHQRELRSFLELEKKFVEQHLEALKEVQSEWPEARPGSAAASSHSHTLSRTSTMSSDPKDAANGAKHAPPLPSRFGSHRSSRSLRSIGSDKKNSAHIGNESEESDESDREATVSRPPSRASRKMSLKGSRPSSRQSKGRSRSDSVATTVSASAPHMSDDTASAKTNGKHRKTTSNVASWVGDAMTSVMGRSKPRISDKENFSALGDGDDEGRADGKDVVGKRSRKLSNRSTKSNKSAGGRSYSQSGFDADFKKPERKVMKALYDFSGSSDELSFRAGEEIVVLHEVLDDWWLGEAGGRKGLFPTNYATVVKTATPRSKSASTSNILGLGQLSRRNSKARLDEESRRILVSASDTDVSADGEDEHDGESISEWQPFDDRHHAPAPQGSGTVLDSLDYRADYGDSDISDREFRRKLSMSLAKLDVQRLPSRPAGDEVRSADVSTSSPSSSPVKRIPPPPPPPRRQPASANPGGPPPLPTRNSAPIRAQSAGAMINALVPPSTESRRAHSDTSSPFESQSELSFDTVATTYAHSTIMCRSCNCEDFVEDPFRGRSICANCAHPHD
ncbi:hypothetical protein M0805_004514 [Coniferiporia weirii]|nr:hypothetical protein M0805_004514 [Coniferiporia weirii]